MLIGFPLVHGWLGSESRTHATNIIDTVLWCVMPCTHVLHDGSSLTETPHRGEPFWWVRRLSLGIEAALPQRAH